MEFVEIAEDHNRQDYHDLILVVRLGYSRGVSEPCVGLDELGDEERDEGCEDVVRGDLAGEEEERDEKTEDETEFPQSSSEDEGDEKTKDLTIFPHSSSDLRHIQLHFLLSADCWAP